jgi:hypothetical protein
MKKNLLYLSLCIILFSSCGKTLEDRLIGDWKLTGGYRQRAFDRDYFTTGYESGVFSFNENGTAVYKDAFDTLYGYWNADRYTGSFYNHDNGRWDDRTYRYLKINLVNFNRNKYINWEFDDFIFKNNRRRIKATQYSFSTDRVFEFVQD